jgi:hypothetical protein
MPEQRTDFDRQFSPSSPFPPSKCQQFRAAIGCGAAFNSTEPVPIDLSSSGYQIPYVEQGKSKCSQLKAMISGPARTQKTSGDIVRTSPRGECVPSIDYYAHSPNARATAIGQSSPTTTTGSVSTPRTGRPWHIFSLLQNSIFGENLETSSPPSSPQTLRRKSEGGGYNVRREERGGVRDFEKEEQEQIMLLQADDEAQAECDRASALCQKHLYQTMLHFQQQRPR